MSFHKPNVGSSMQINQQHHGNKVPVGGIIIKHTNPNMIPTNPIIHTTNSYQNNTQSVIGGLQQNTVRQSGIPTNQIVTSMTQTHPPPQLTNQNGIMTPSGDAAAVGNQNQAHTGDQQQDHQTEQQKSTETALANTKEKTPMCLINELARYNKISHQYTLVDEQGPAHKKTFYVTLKLGDKGEEYSANGPSIKKAQHAAAAKALESTSFTHPPPKPPKTIVSRPVSSYVVGSQIMPTVELNALAMKRGEQTLYKPIDTRQQAYYPPPNYNFRGMYNQRYHYPRMPRIYHVSLKVGQREFIGEGTSRQEARHDAAAKALNILNKLPMPNDDGRKVEQKPDEENLEENDLKSEISLVHEIALKRNLNVSFDVIRESGPPHMKNFVTRCTVGDIETEAEGNSKKFSKKKAAEMMLEKLKDLPPLPPSALKPKNKTVTNKKKSKNIIKQMHRADPNYGVGINPISRLIQIQQAQQKKEPVYALVAERGLPRRREFVIQVTVDDETCTGVGPNKKLAKRHAAESMLNLLGYNKPSPQPTKPAIKTSSTPEHSSEGDKKVNFGMINEKKVTFMENSEESSGEMVNGKTGRQLVPGLLLLPDSSYTGGNPIYNQGIPNSLPPGALKGTDPMVFQTCPPPIRPEIQLRDIATRNNIDLKFDEFSAKGQSEFLSRASLMTNPPRVFHGSGPTIEASRDMAAMEAMKYMAELGKDLSNNVPQMKKEAEELANSSNMGGTHPGRVSAM